MSLIIIRFRKFANVQSARIARLLYVARNKLYNPHTFITCAIPLYISATLNSLV